VLKAQCIKNGKYVAIKCMKNHFDSLDQVGSSDGRRHGSRHSSSCTSDPAAPALLTSYKRPQDKQRLPCSSHMPAA
jgi:hypothetical protein